MTDFLRRLVKEKPLSIIAGVVILLLMLVAIFADVLAPFPHDEVNIVDRTQAPSGRYLLGTDQLGRDLLSRLIFGAQISLTIGLAATTVNVVVAVLIGGPSGFFGGRLDLAAQRFVDAWMAFPGLLLLLTIMSLVGRGVPQIIVVLGVTGGIGGSRVIRGAVIGVKENVYFQAAEAIGSTKWRILIRHVLPNIAAPVIIIFTINVGGVIISEAALSFLGFGLPISVPSWGGMLSREGREFMEVAPRLALWPGLCLTIVVYCLNMFGDAVRDLLDPAAARRWRPSRRPGRDGVVVDCRQDLLCGAILGPSLKDDVRSDGHGGHQVLGRCRPPHRFEGESGAGGQACVGSAPAGVADQPWPWRSGRSVRGRLRGSTG